MNNLRLSVIIPAHNEALRIGGTLESIGSYFRNKNIAHEIIVVDDGSTDGTVEVVAEYARTIENIRILRNETNRGKGHSVRFGMKEARGEYRLFMDADNSVDISHLDRFFEHMEDGGHDVVIGSIRLTDSRVAEHCGWHRRVLRFLAKIIIAVLVVPGVRDTQRGFKLFSQRAAEAIFSLQTIERFGFDIEILVIASLNGFRIKEVPVSWNNPSGSKVTLGSYVRTFQELLYITRNRLKGKYALP